MRLYMHAHPSQRLLHEAGASATPLPDAAKLYFEKGSATYGATTVDADRSRLLDVEY